MIQYSFCCSNFEPKKLFSQLIFIISVNSLLDKMLIKFHYNWLLIYFLLQKFLKNSWRKYVLRLEWNDFLHYANAKINYCSLVFISYYGVQVQKNRPIQLLRHFQMKFVCGQWIVTPLHAFFPLYGHKHVWVVKCQHIIFIIYKSIEFFNFWTE